MQQPHTAYLMIQDGEAAAVALGRAATEELGQLLQVLLPVHKQKADLSITFGLCHYLSSTPTKGQGDSQG